MTELTSRQILDAIREGLEESDRIAKERPDGTAAPSELKQAPAFIARDWPGLDDFLRKVNEDLARRADEQPKEKEQPEVNALPASSQNAKNERH